MLSKVRAWLDSGGRSAGLISALILLFLLGVFLLFLAMVHPIWAYIALLGCVAVTARYWEWFTKGTWLTVGIIVILSLLAIGNAQYDLWGDLQWWWWEVKRWWWSHR